MVRQLNMQMASKAWYINNKLHRKDSPAVEYANGYKAWFINGSRHRTDGPAIEYPDGNKSWWYHGKRINVSSQEEFELYLKNPNFYLKMNNQSIKISENLLEAYR